MQGPRHVVTPHVKAKGSQCKNATLTFFMQCYNHEQRMREQLRSQYLQEAASSQIARNCPQGCSADGPALGGAR